MRKKRVCVWTEAAVIAHIQKIHLCCVLNLKPEDYSNRSLKTEWCGNTTIHRDVLSFQKQQQKKREHLKMNNLI